MSLSIGRWAQHHGERKRRAKMVVQLGDVTELRRQKRRKYWSVRDGEKKWVSGWRDRREVGQAGAAQVDYHGEECREKGRGPGSRLEWKSSNCFDLEPSRGVTQSKGVMDSTRSASRSRLKSQLAGILVYGKDPDEQTVPVGRCFGWEGDIVGVVGQC